MITPCDLHPSDQHLRHSLCPVFVVQRNGKNHPIDSCHYPPRSRVEDNHISYLDTRKQLNQPKEPVNSDSQQRYFLHLLPHPLSLCLSPTFPNYLSLSLSSSVFLYVHESTWQFASHCPLCTFINQGSGLLRVSPLGRRSVSCSSACCAHLDPDHAKRSGRSCGTRQATRRPQEGLCGCIMYGVFYVSQSAVIGSRTIMNNEPTTSQRRPSTRS